MPTFEISKLPTVMVDLLHYSVSIIAKKQGTSLMAQYLPSVATQSMIYDVLLLK